MTSKYGKVKDISLELIDDPKSPVRSRMDSGALDNLVASIRNVGILQPLIVREHGKRYEVIAGHRRLVAASMAGLITVPCVVCRADNTTTAAIRLHENLYREDLNIVDEAVYFGYLRAKQGLSIGEIAARISRSHTYVEQRLAILDYPDNFVKALRGKQITPTAAKYLVQIKDSKLRDEYLGYAMRSGVTSATARHWFETWNRGELASRAEKQVVKDIKTGAPRIVPFIKCELCGRDIEMGTQKVIFVHQECIEEFQRIADSKE